MSSEQDVAAVWDEQSLRAPHEAGDKARRVEAMFDAIAPTYEQVNRVATFGMDAGWRRRAVQSTRPQADDVVLDVCCGTGDMVREFARAQPALRQIIGLDFSGPMLAAGRYPEMSTPYALVRADGLRLPLRDACVDVISCAFGVRNFQRLDAGLREMGRVARSGARIAILEFANPENAVLRFGYRLYCETILPRLGAWIARDRVGAYKYLPKSIETFETRRSICAKLEAAGFANVAATSMNMGGVVLYTGTRR